MILSIKKRSSILQFLALSLLLGFELSYYLLIIQTGIAQHYHSDLIKLSPLFLGGITGTILSAHTWGKITNPIHKIIFALSLQLGLSLLYPDFSPYSLCLLGISVGMMAPLSIYLFKAHQRKELFLALALAYSVGTYGFNSLVDSREWMALSFTLLALISAFVLRDYKVKQDKHIRSTSFAAYLPLMLWVLVDSNLFETLCRHESINIWAHHTYLIIAFHILGLISAFLLKTSTLKHHLIIFLLFILSYVLSYIEHSVFLAIIYPFAISYYNVIVFLTLSKEMNLYKLAYMMVFIGWVASGLGLALALSRVLH